MLLPAGGRVLFAGGRGLVLPAGGRALPFPAGGLPLLLPFGGLPLLFPLGGRLFPAGDLTLTGGLPPGRAGGRVGNGRGGAGGLQPLLEGGRIPCHQMLLEYHGRLR